MTREQEAILKRRVARWMRDHRSEHIDPKTGEMNYTGLAEDAADVYDMNREGGALDNDTHWIWDMAITEGDRE